MACVDPLLRWAVADESAARIAAGCLDNPAPGHLSELEKSQLAWSHEAALPAGITPPRRLAVTIARRGAEMASHVTYCASTMPAVGTLAQPGIDARTLRDLKHERAPMADSHTTRAGPRPPGHSLAMLSWQATGSALSRLLVR